MNSRYDIFCTVVDNYGDIGVCWRLARQLSQEHGLEVRLWVDDLSRLARLCLVIDDRLEIQHSHGVEVRLWHKNFPETDIADVVIETFACVLPDSYIVAMAKQAQPPVWVNLEYLSAEKWVESYHQLPSPHPTLPLTKYFFFPGFTQKTGGLLLERDLLARRDAFQLDVSQQQAFWQSVGMEMPSSEMLIISLFSYENGALPKLFEAWVSSEQPVLCLVPEGRIVRQVGHYFNDPEVQAGSAYVRGNLQVRVLPFLEQDRYDLLLWVCNINFVRGEDSWVRALWAGRPLVWQIYPQHDAAHLKKLQAFVRLYTQQLHGTANQAVQDLWNAWNRGGEDGSTTSLPLAWRAFAGALDELKPHAQYCSRHWAENNLALNLLDFCREMGTIRALKIEGQ